MFCHLTSSPSIKLSKGNKVAKQTTANTLAFITENIFLRPKIAFKVRLRQKVLLGVAHLPTIINNKLK